MVLGDLGHGLDRLEVGVERAVGEPRHLPPVVVGRQVLAGGDRAGADTTPRAALLIAICAGVILDRMLLGHTELNSPGTENLIPYLHAALDAVAKAPEPAPGS